MLPWSSLPACNDACTLANCWLAALDLAMAVEKSPDLKAAEASPTRPCYSSRTADCTIGKSSGGMESMP